MRVVIQRVARASVKCSGGHFDEIGTGLLVLASIEKTDKTEDIEWLSGKICHLRVFDDKEGIMNLGVMETGGEILAISQFTLHASTRKGNRPSYIKAAPAGISEPLFREFINQLEEDLGRPVKKGVFGDYMEVMLINDGPVTIIIDTKNRE